MKALVFCSDGIDDSSGYLTGGGIRSLQICNYLDNNNFVVIKSVPVHANSINKSDCTYESNPEFLLSIIREYTPNLVVFCNATTFTLGRSFEEFKIWIDVHGPIFYESSLISNTSFETSVHHFIASLKYADIITSVSILQKTALNFFTVGSSVENIFIDKISVFPIKTDHKIVEHSLGENLIIGYCGSVYPWIDPIEYIDAIAKHEEISVLLFSNHHNLTNAKSINIDFYELFLRHNNIKFHSLVPFEKLLHELSKIDILFDLSTISGERLTAVNTRVLDFISMGIPVVINSYSYMARYYKNELSNILVDSIQDVDRVLIYLKNIENKEYQLLKLLSIEAYNLYQNEITFSIDKYI